MVRGCSAAVGNFTEVIHNRVGGEERRLRVWNSFLSPSFHSAIQKQRKEKRNVKKLRSYSSIWKVEQVIHSFGDAKLPIPMTVTQIIWFISMELAVVMLKNVPPLSFTDNPLFLYGCIPTGVTWFMSKKTFDGKKPYKFLQGVVAYALRPKVTFAGKPVRLRKRRENADITIVRSEIIRAVSH